MNFKVLELNRRRGDIASAFYIIMFLVIVAFVFFLFTSMNNSLFGELKTKLESNSGYEATESYNVTVSLYDMNNGQTWDWAFFAIFMGSLVAAGISVWAIKVSPIFYWIYGLLSLFIVVMGVILSNLWQRAYTEEAFVNIASNFPITNFILGTYYPMIVTGIILLMLVILFAKPGGEQ